MLGSGDHSVPIDSVMQDIQTLDVHDDVGPGLELLRETGIRAVALTNGSAATATGLLERAGLVHLVEEVMSVDDVGRWKPAAEAYYHALGRCGAEPEEAMLVAVHPWDVDGAKRAGLQAAWINRADSLYPRIVSSPDIVAGDLSALASMLADGSARQGANGRGGDR